MRQVVQVILVLSMVTFNLPAVAQETEDARTGIGKAVEKIQKDGSFKLSAKAMNTIGIRLEPMGNSPRKLLKTSLVYYGAKVGVFRLRDGFFKLIEVKITRSPGWSFMVTSPELNPSDEIAVEGVALLRVSEMDAFGGEG